MAVSSRVIFVNRFFHPDHSATSELLSDLAFALSERGFHVAVITSRLRYESGTPLPPRDSTGGVDVHRVWTSRRGRRRLLGRLCDYNSFYLSAGWRLWRLARAGDVIVAKTDPPLISVVAATAAALRGAKLINWQQDVFPEAAQTLRLGGAVGALCFSLLRRPRNWSLRRARRNVALGDHMAATLSQQDKRVGPICVIPNWSDGSLIRPIPAADNELRSAWGLRDHFVVGYAGNLGRAHDINAVLKAMTALNGIVAPKPIRFLFVGGGALRPKLQAEAARLCLKNVEFRDYQPREHLSAALCVADIHLVILNPKLEGLIVPSKFYAVAAAGRPVIFIGDRSGELAHIVNEEGIGFAVPPSRPEELKQRILQFATSPQLCRIMGKRARATFERRWDKPVAIERWAQLLSAEIGMPQPAAPPAEPAAATGANSVCN